MLEGMSRFQVLSDGQWALIEDLMPVRTGKRGRPFQDARSMVEGIIYRYRCGIAWRDVIRYASAIFDWELTEIEGAQC